ncbi:hypothetical protein GCM10023093_13560 [Nemorincola caseinilytica]|uniref:Oligosaccharide repeat unit polymerase n=2 Tax=Nemorincola caseinilytica TaxID=2054315 RepID=A0ABP8NCA3_9BACT
MTTIAVSAAAGRKINVISAFAAGVVIITLGNASFASKVVKHGVDSSSMYYYVSAPHLNEAALVWSVGCSFIFIGYEMFAKRSFPSLSIIVDSPRALRNIFWVSIGLCMLRLSGTFIDLNFISGGVQKLFALSSIMSVLLFARLWGKQGTLLYRNYAMGICAALATVALFQGFLRIDLATPFIVFFGGYFIGLGSIRYLFSYRVIPMAVVVIAFSTVFGNLGANRSHFIDTFTNPVEEVAPSYTISSTQNSDRNSLLIRGGNIAQISNVCKLVERNGHYNGEASAPLIFAFIPRVLWPEKPTIEIGAWFALEIGVAAISAQTGRANNSINMSIPGQFFLDFGWIGVALGCLFFGAVLAMFWNAAEFNGSPYNVMGVLWGGYLLFYAILGIGADLQIFITFCSTYLTIFIVKKIYTSLYAHSQRRPAMEG